jgi:hypothetical protein
MRILTTLLSLILAASKHTAAPPIHLIMGPSTRSKQDDFSVNRLKHIQNVWMKGNFFVDAYLFETGITKYSDFARRIMNMDIINSLKVHEGEEDEMTCTEDTLERLKACISYVNHIQMDWGPINEDGPADITKYDGDMFEGYYSMNIPFEAYDDKRAIERKERKQLQAARVQAIVSGGNGTGNLSGTTSATSGANPSANPPSSSSTLSAAANLRKTIKIDPASFPVLKDDAQWHSFHRQMIAICALFKMEDVLNSLYVPTAGGMKELFETQQAFLINVLTKNVLTVKGQEIVDKYISSIDAQKAWSELVLYYTGPGSIVSKYRVDELRRKIHHSLDADYRGSRLITVISEWERQLAEYDSLRGIVTSPAEKLTLFESFLSNIRQLKSVSTMQAMVAALIQATSTTASPLTPEATINLYKQQAEIVDNDRKQSAVTQRRRIVQELQVISDIRQTYAAQGFRQVNVAQLLDDTLSNDAWYDILIAKQNGRDVPRITQSAWKSLTLEEQTMWKGLSDHAKNVILNDHTTGPLPIRPIQPTRRPPFRPSASNDPNSASRARDSPLAQGARVNAAEVQTTVDTSTDIQLQANLSEIMDRLNVGVHEWGDDWRESDFLLEQMRDVNQTSILPPFAMPRFLSQDDGGSLVADAYVDNSEPNDGGTEFIDNSPGQVEACMNEWNNTSDVAVADTGGVRFADYLQSSYDDENNAYSIFALERPLYSVSEHSRWSRKPRGMVDRGANGGVHGDGVCLRVISLIPNMFIDIQGIDDHTLSHVPIGSVGGVARVQGGREIIVVFHQYAILGRGKTIHSAIQLEDWNNQVSDTALAFGGQQRIVTAEGYVIPLDISNGLVYINTRPFTDDEWDRLPIVDMTRDEPWNPSRHDSRVSNDPQWHANQDDVELPNPDFNAYGENCIEEEGRGWSKISCQNSRSC